MNEHRSSERTTEHPGSPLERSLVEQYTAASYESRRRFERARAVLPGGLTRRTVYFPPYPNYIERGEGCRIYDVDGRSYIDLACNYGPLILGHRHPRVMRAIEAQLERGTVLGGPTELEAELAEVILRAVPSGEQVLFCSSGTEANMLGLRALRAYTGREKILRCVGSFHGTSDSFGEGPGIPHGVGDRTVTVPFNDAGLLEEAVRKHRAELAAGLATLEELTDGAYAHLERTGEALTAGLREAAESSAVGARIVGVGSIFQVHFTDAPVTDAASAASGSRRLARLFDLALLLRGVFPAKAHCSFVSTPLTRSDVQQVVDAARDAFREIARRSGRS